MLGQFDFLTLDECKQVHDKIYDMKKFWNNRAFGFEPFFTLGTASYLDSPGKDDSYYLKNAEETNPILKENFAFLYDRLLKLLSGILKIPVSYEKNWLCQVSTFLNTQRVLKNPLPRSISICNLYLIIGSTIRMLILTTP